MSELSELGYPEGYHMGLSAILWIVFIIVIIILGIKLNLNAKKSNLINVKEMLRVKGIGFFCVGIQVYLIQVGVFYPNYFIQFYLFGGFIITSTFAFYFYYCEKSLFTP